MGRINPLHVMLRTGTDAYSGSLDHRGIRSADDLVVMPLQSGTQWDGLGHVFFEEHMWNGYDCREVSSAGAQKCGIEKTRARMVGRGVLIDVPGFFGVDCLDDGYAITPRISTGPQSPRASRSDAAITSSSAPGRWRQSSRRTTGMDTPAATLLAWPSAHFRGYASARSPPSPRIPGAARCGRTAQVQRSHSLGTGSPSRSSGLPSGRSSISLTWPKTAGGTALRIHVRGTRAAHHRSRRVAH